MFILTFDSVSHPLAPSFSIFDKIKKETWSHIEIKFRFHYIPRYSSWISILQLYHIFTTVSSSFRQIIACCFTNIRAKSFEKDLILNNLRNNYPPSPSITTIHIETFQKNLSSTNSSTISTRKTIFPIFQLPRAITFAFSVLHPSHACKKRENLSQATWPRPDHDHPYPSIHLSIHFVPFLRKKGYPSLEMHAKSKGGR